jgi:hypothetical protein
MSSRQDDELGAALGAVVVVSILITAWLLSKALEMVIRVWMVDPRNRLLWWTTGIALVMVLLLALTAGQVPVVNALTGLAVTALLLVCKALDMYYDTLLQQQLTRGGVIHDVLQEPWFQVA